MMLIACGSRSERAIQAALKSLVDKRPAAGDSFEGNRKP